MIYLWLTCVFIGLSVHFDFIWSTRYSRCFLSVSLALSSPDVLLKTIIWVYVLVCVSLFLPAVCTVTTTWVIEHINEQYLKPAKQKFLVSFSFTVSNLDLPPVNFIMKEVFYCFAYRVRRTSSFVHLPLKERTSWDSKMIVGTEQEIGAKQLIYYPQ